MPLILGTNSIKDTGYNVDNSCRFNDGDSPRLLIANPTAGTRTKAAEQETAITNAADTPALETLYTCTEQEDGSVTRPLGELPTLES